MIISINPYIIHTLSWYACYFWILSASVFCFLHSWIKYVFSVVDVLVCSQPRLPNAFHFGSINQHTAPFNAKKKAGEQFVTTNGPNFFDGFWLKWETDFKETNGKEAKHQETSASFNFICHPSFPSSLSECLNIYWILLTIRRSTTWHMAIHNSRWFEYTFLGFTAFEMPFLRS